MVLTTNPYDRYRQQGVMTASPMELIVMLYDGCIRQLRVAVLAVKDGNEALSSEALVKAQAIVQELSLSLDRSYELSSELSRIYEFVEETIYQAIQQKDLKDIPAVTDIMVELHETWNEVAKKTRASSLAIEE